MFFCWVLFCFPAISPFLFSGPMGYWFSLFQPSFFVLVHPSITLANYCKIQKVQLCPGTSTLKHHANSFSSFHLHPSALISAILPPSVPPSLSLSLPLTDGRKKNILMSVHDLAGPVILFPHGSQTDLLTHESDLFTIVIWILKFRIKWVYETL